MVGGGGEIECMSIDRVRENRQGVWILTGHL